MKQANQNITTYRRIRKAIGILGIIMPITLVVLSCFTFFDTPMQQSISSYYHTNLREIFTGTLCSVGLFLFLYEGNTNKNLLKNDKLLTNIAGVLAILVAIIPTNIEDCSQKVKTLIPLCTDYDWIGYIHYGCAALLFLIFAIICLHVFVIRPNENTEIETSIMDENHIYKFCGYVILISMVLCLILGLYADFKYSTLLSEIIMLLAFGTAWLIKGRILGDTGKIGRMLYKE